MKSPVLSLYYLLLAIFLFAGCPIEQLMAQMNTDTTRYITIEGLVRDQNDRKRLELVKAFSLSRSSDPCRQSISSSPM